MSITFDAFYSAEDAISAKDDTLLGYHHPCLEKSVQYMIAHPGLYMVGVTYPLFDRETYDMFHVIVMDHPPVKGETIKAIDPSIVYDSNVNTKKNFSKESYIPVAVLGEGVGKYGGVNTMTTRNRIVKLAQTIKSLEDRNTTWKQIPGPKAKFLYERGGDVYKNNGQYNTMIDPPGKWDGEPTGGAFWIKLTDDPKEKYLRRWQAVRDEAKQDIKDNKEVDRPHYTNTSVERGYESAIAQAKKLADEISGLTNGNGVPNNYNKVRPILQNIEQMRSELKSLRKKWDAADKEYEDNRVSFLMEARQLWRKQYPESYEKEKAKATRLNMLDSFNKMYGNTEETDG